MPEPHAYRCACSECRAMVAAISAQNPDGAYFFSDDELEQLLTSPNTVFNVENPR